MLKKLLSCTILTCITFSLLFSFSFAEGNILKNPSFEEETGGLPAHWSKWQYELGPGISEFKLAKGDAHSGDTALTITNHSANDARVKQQFPVKKDATYKLSCWIKAENVGSKKTGAIISLEGRTETSKNITNTKGKWEYSEMFVKIGDDLNTLVLTLGVGGYGNMNTGTASFDDVSVEEVTSVPQGVVPAVIKKIAPQDSIPQEPGNSTESPQGSKIILWGILGFVVVIVILFIIYVMFKKNTLGENDTRTEANDDHDDFLDEEEIGATDNDPSEAETTKTAVNDLDADTSTSDDFLDEEEKK